MTSVHDDEAPCLPEQLSYKLLAKQHNPRNLYAARIPEQSSRVRLE